jgi:hypothetical protein
MRLMILAFLVTFSAEAQVPTGCELKVASFDTVRKGHEADIGKYLMEHIAFINSRLADGSILYTGAINDIATGRPLQGLTIYETGDANLSDPEQLSQALERVRQADAGDPFVKNRVVKVVYRTWNLCQQAK